MSDENLNAKASFEVDVQNAIRAINQATTATAKLNDALGNQTPKALSRFEKSSVGAAQAAQQLSTKTNAAGVAHTSITAKIDKTSRSLASERYALYDVASTWGIVAAATLGAAAAAAKITVDYQTAFAQVQRTSQTTGAAAQELRDSLVDLTTAIPSNFGDVTQIATLGAQLGVATDGLTDFTKTVAQFTATTNVGLDASATGLARIAELTDAYATSGTEAYSRVGSAILKTGVNSIATESQIISVAKEIATTGDLYGFAADQTIGYASALASLGVPAERTRGAFQRTLSTISTAVTTGGADLQKFADLAGLSATQFQKAWSDNAGATFEKVLSGIGTQLKTSGTDYKTFLATLGITASRDAETIARLANNTDVLTSAMADSASGYADNTELTKQYGVIAETVASKLAVLANTLKAIVDAVGQQTTGPFANIIGAVETLAKGFLALARNPVGQIFIAIAAAVNIVIGVFATYRAVQALTTASLDAMIQAQDSLNARLGKNNLAVGGLAKQMTLMAIGTDRATAATNAYGKSIDAGNGKAKSFAVGTKAAASAAGGLGVALKGIVSATVVGALLTGVTMILSHFATESANAKASVEGFTASLDTQTGAITENTRTWAFNQLQQNGWIAKAQEMGIDTNNLVSAILGQKDAIAQVNDEIAKYQSANSTASGFGGVDQVDPTAATKIANLRKEFAVLSDQAVQGKADFEAAAYAIGTTGDAATEAADDTTDYTDALSTLLSTQTDTINNTVGMQNALYGLGSSLAENGNSFSAYSAAGRENLGALQQVLSAMVTSAGGDSTVLATLLAGLMQSLSGYGVDAVNQLGFVQSMLAQLTGGKGTSGLTGVTTAANQAGSALSQGFSSGATKAAKSANQAKKEVKTLSDYVSDLSGVFDNAFDFRFGLEQSVDDVSAAWQAFADYTDEAAQAVADARSDMDDTRQSIEDLHASLLQLTADRSVLEFQLKVATDYGDTLRASEITAELAQNSADLTENSVDTTKAQDDLTDQSKTLTKAQAALDKSLVGSTTQSADQREMVLSLLEAYQKEVVALANTGMSQSQLSQETARLRSQFVSQLTQMGYNRAEVDRYATAFDDLTYSIAKVPRNITVNADTDPATRALNEFLAKAQTANASVSVGVDVGSSGADAANAWANMFKQTIARSPVAVDGYYFNGEQVYRVPGTGLKLYDSGGYTGRGGRYDPAGIVHKGEYVVPKPLVNQSTGLPYASAFGQLPTSSGSTNNYYSGGPVSGNSGGIGLVELLPTQLAELKAGQQVHVYLDGKEITAAVNRVNFGSARRGSN